MNKLMNKHLGMADLLARIDRQTRRLLLRPINRVMHRSDGLYYHTGGRFRKLEEEASMLYTGGNNVYITGPDSEELTELVRDLLEFAQRSIGR